MKRIIKLFLLTIVCSMISGFGSLATAGQRIKVTFDVKDKNIYANYGFKSGEFRSSLSNPLSDTTVKSPKQIRMENAQPFCLDKGFDEAVDETHWSHDSEVNSKLRYFMSARLYRKLENGMISEAAKKNLYAASKRPSYRDSYFETITCEGDEDSVVKKFTENTVLSATHILACSGGSFSQGYEIFREGVKPGESCYRLGNFTVGLVRKAMTEAYKIREISNVSQKELPPMESLFDDEFAPSAVEGKR